MADEPAVQSGQFQMRDIHILLQDAHFMNVPKASHSVNRTPVIRQRKPNSASSLD